MPEPRALPCTCPDPWCQQHARCRCGSDLIITGDDPAFCPACLMDVMPVGACKTEPSTKCGKCGRPVHKAGEPRRPDTRWRHVHAASDAACEWGLPGKPGVQLR